MSARTALRRAWTWLRLGALVARMSHAHDPKYSRLQEEAEWLAARLQEAPVASVDPAAICGTPGRSPEYYEAIERALHNASVVVWLPDLSRGPVFKDWTEIHRQGRKSGMAPIPLPPQVPRPDKQSHG